MLSKEDFAVIKALNQRGVYLKDIAEQLGVHPKTVSRALKRKGAPQKERKRRESKLDPYKPKIDRLLGEGVWNAVVILREIQADGYKGGTTILREYIEPKRALRSGRATVRFETEPGEQLQSDWGKLVEIAGQPTSVLQVNSWDIPGASTSGADSLMPDIPTNDPQFRVLGWCDERSAGG
jgi:transposase